MDLTDLTISRIHKGLEKKEFSAEELVKIFLDRIEKEDNKINAFLTVTPELALSQSKEVDEKISRGEKIDILAGVPAAIKDIILVENIKCTAASKILENYLAVYDATVVKKLKEKGISVIGKTNMDEFAMGSSTENSSFKTTKNPHDLSRVPGGSSGGSAAAVAADLCTFALGSDTGGSIRQPASFCGVVGLKPTYGSVSRYGLMAYASSLDQIGPITKTVEDCKIVFNAIKGKDELDSTSVNYPDLPKNKFDIRDIRIGIPKEYFACPVGSRRDSCGVKGMDEEVEKVIRGAIKRYEESGARIEVISLPHTEYALACYYIIAMAEASANLARYDGIKYGLSKSQGHDLLDVYLQSREEGFGAEVRRRIILGTYTLSAGYYDAYYLRAQKVRTLIREDFEKAFKKVDVILTPVSPTPAFKIGEKVDDPLTMYLSDIFTISINLAGLPALSIPCGKVGKLPVGLQIIGKPFDEEKILETGKIFEKLYV